MTFKGTVIEVVVLMLLILTFGMQQRHRPQVYFRLWLIGWIFVLAAYLIWSLPVPPGLMADRQDAVRYNLLFFGVLCFLASFEYRSFSWKRTLQGMALLAVPAGVTFYMVLLHHRIAGVLATAVVLMQLAFFRQFRSVLPEGWSRRKVVIYGVLFLFSVWMGRLVWSDPNNSLVEIICSEALIGLAVLYGAAYAHRSFAGSVGAAGFAIWASLYVAALVLQPRHSAVRLVYALWSLPKYMIGFSMIVKIFEDTRQEQTVLAGQFQSLYEDFRLLYEEHPHPMWICEPATGKLLSVNQAMVREYGYSAAECVGMHMADLVATPQISIAASSTGGASSEAQGAQHRYKDGRLVWVTMAERAITFQGRPGRLLIARDVTERRKVEEELTHRANHDVLTGLPNRVMLEGRIQRALDVCRRDRCSVALMTIDIDHFKNINDDHGHLVGDACLQAMTVRLQSKVRRVDTIARIGGDEFLAIIGDLRDAHDARKVADTLVRLFDEPLQLAQGPLKVSLSIGVALFPGDGDEIETLRRRSDEALYVAKRNGRNGVVLASEIDAMPHVSKV
jgi:diguanylate cyclase (GGDEF)-like protein/PAS domain S-box-containing protein